MLSIVDGGRLLKIEEVAEILRVHESTVRRLIASGEVPAHRVGSQWRIRSDELDFYIDSTPRSAAA
jgi:excisionase family DNA binding protein